MFKGTYNKGSLLRFKHSGMLIIHFLLIHLPTNEIGYLCNFSKGLILKDKLRKETFLAFYKDETVSTFSEEWKVMAKMYQNSLFMATTKIYNAIQI